MQICLQGERLTEARQDKSVNFECWFCILRHCCICAQICICILYLRYISTRWVEVRAGLSKIVLYLYFATFTHLYFSILYPVFVFDICYLLRGGEHWEGWSERRRAQHHWQITFLFLFTTSASTLNRVISNAAIVVIFATNNISADLNCLYISLFSESINFDLDTVTVMEFR